MKLQQEYTKSYLLKLIFSFFILNTIIGTIIALFLYAVMKFSFSSILLYCQIISHVVSLFVVPTCYIIGTFLKEKSLFIEIPVFIICCMIATTLGLKISSLILGSHIFYEILLPMLLFTCTSSTIIKLFYRFKSTKLKIEKELIELKEKTLSNKKSYLSIKEMDKPYLIECNEIVYLSSYGKKTAIHTEDKDYETSQLIKDVEQKLPSDIFLRIHKQFIINLKYISGLRHQTGGRYIVYLNDEDENNLPVGRKYIPVLKEKLKHTGIV